MSENCNHDCGSCGSDCESRETKQDFTKKLQEGSSVKKVIGVVSGKGGVGKSMVTSMLAIAANKAGKHTAIFDADITGPSIPKTFGLTQKATSDGQVLYPVTSAHGIDIMSTNLILDHDTDPVIWRGPVIAGVVQQFWTDVLWDNIDVMFVDMPPGTGDVPLTVFQSLPVDGIIIVTTPQDLVSMIVEKAINMAAQMDVPIIGIVQNMSYFQCPDCGNKHYIFGKSDIKELAATHGIDRVAELPIDSQLAVKCDEGNIETYAGNNLKIIDETFTELF